MINNRQWNHLKLYTHRFIGEEGLKKISENGTITDVKELVKRALDVSVYRFLFVHKFFLTILKV